MLNWGDYEGRFAETWRLDSFLGMREGRALFSASNAAGTAKALMQLVSAEDDLAVAQRASWESASQLSEAHLLPVHETGETGFDGVRAIYAVCDLPDDDVGEIIAGGAVSPEEGRRITSAAASALDYLHKLGLRHGAVKPSNIFLVGDTIKLSADTIAPADEAGRETDLRQLGNTIVEVMTGETEPEAARRLPMPFRDIAIGCLKSPGGEWTAERVLWMVWAKPVAVSEGNDDKAPPPSAGPSVTAAPDASPVEAVRRRWPVVAGIVGISVAALIVYVFNHPTAHPPPAPPPHEMIHPSAPVEPPPSPARQAVAPEPSPAVVNSVAERRGTTPVSGSWAVVAATYKALGGAENRARKIRAMSPQLRAHVYPTEAGRDRYYVVLGSGLTRVEADQLRSVAQQLGAPRDTYVTKLNETGGPDNKTAP